MREVIDPKQILAAQERLDNELRSKLPDQGMHRLGYRGGGKELRLHSKGKGQLYYASIFIDRADTSRRFWNAFGMYDGNTNATQRIGVEINIPNPPNRDVAAFLAEDTAGNTFLMHSGRMGGGKEGVCREGFLEHSGLEPVSVRSSGGQRSGVIVAKLGDANMVNSIARFARAVVAYKESVNPV